MNNFVHNIFLYMCKYNLDDKFLEVVLVSQSVKSFVSLLDTVTSNSIEVSPFCTLMVNCLW